MFVVIDAYLHDLTELNLITELEVAETFLIFKINSTLSNLYHIIWYHRSRNVSIFIMPLFWIYLH